MEQVINFIILAVLVKAFTAGIDLMIKAWVEYREGRQSPSTPNTSDIACEREAS